MCSYMQKIGQSQGSMFHTKAVIMSFYILQELNLKVGTGFFFFFSNFKILETFVVALSKALSEKTQVVQKMHSSEK